MVESRAKREYMLMDVILTFNTPDIDGETQEFFYLQLPINKNEVNAEIFIEKKLFKRVAKKCQLLNRSVGDLIKISTGSDWKTFKKTTKMESLADLGHSCKWYFGKGRCDLDSWEIELMESYGFGMEADMSFIDINWVQALRAEIAAHKKTKSCQMASAT